MEPTDKYKERIDQILSSKETFNKFLYINIYDAISEINDRQKDKKIDEMLEPYLKDDFPEILRGAPKAVLFRQVITPNYEIRRFMCIPDATELDPVFFEYHQDKFTSNNPLKFHLGKMGFHHGIGKKGGLKLSHEMIIDFNKSNGKKISQVQTVWGQSLIDFHHELLEKTYPNLCKNLFDASDWFHKKGCVAKEYYRSYVALFVKNAILFENFVLEGDELDFTRNIFLPAFLEIYDKTGKKPLIVALEPTEIESDVFWMCHTPETIPHVKGKMLLSQKDIK